MKNNKNLENIVEEISACYLPSFHKKSKTQVKVLIALSVCIFCILYLYVRTSARADISQLSFLGNAWMDCAEIRFVVRDQLVKCFTKVKSGHICKGYARANVRTPFPYIWNGWTDCTEIWCG